MHDAQYCTSLPAHTTMSLFRPPQTLPKALIVLVFTSVISPVHAQSTTWSNGNSTASRVAGIIVAILFVLVLLMLIFSFRRRQQRRFAAGQPTWGWGAYRPGQPNTLPQHQQEVPYGHGGYYPQQQQQNQFQDGAPRPGYHPGSEYPPQKQTPAPPPYQPNGAYAPPPGPPPNFGAAPGSPPPAHVHDRQNSFAGGFRA
ncbi:unnamed protein product [Mycena citricolor]|uniref:Uncharacterized protein n=1 Tax=Mycena citricolor TaxID=2018698 RepID=A0AAD2HNF2_9AGAR|nr:unnamed protein product [Mycena citricolor]